EHARAGDVRGGGAQAPELVVEAAEADGALEGERELVHLEGLGDEVVGAGADGGGGGVQAAEGGDHDDGDIRAAAGDALAELGPVHAAEVEVGDDGVEVLGAEGVQGGGGVGEGAGGVAPAGQAVGEQGAHLRVVVHDEQAVGHAVRLRW